MVKGFDLYKGLKGKLVMIPVLQNGTYFGKVESTDFSNAVIYLNPALVRMPHTGDWMEINETFPVHLPSHVALPVTPIPQAEYDAIKAYKPKWRSIEANLGTLVTVFMDKPDFKFFGTLTGVNPDSITLQPYLEFNPLMNMYREETGKPFNVPMDKTDFVMQMPDDMYLRLKKNLHISPEDRAKKVVDPNQLSLFH